MIIIADSGSTKCDWLVLNDSWEIVNHINTMGLNPYFHDEVFILSILTKSAEIREIQNQVKQIYFYGAGCSNLHYKGIMKTGLQNVFTSAKISVNHDLMAAALAGYEKKPVIACILGTGSNSCYFDGNQIVSGPPSLGYIVGDEASGSYFGKILLNAYFYKKLPEDLHKEFENEYQINILDFSKRLYGKQNANVFLASFMKFISERKEHPYFKTIINNGFKLFLENHVKYFKNYQEVETNFIGSVGYYFQDELTAVATELNIKVGEFIQKPVFNLVEMHKNNAQLKMKR